jgi:hypothetical protein
MFDGVGEGNMFKKIGIAVLFLTLGAVSALAADFNGKWNGDVTTPRGTQNLVFDFHVDGATVTGKVTSPRGDIDITNGKVDSDNISFDTVMNFNGNEFTISYKGEADGDTIKFTRAMGDRGSSDFVAKKGAPAAAAPAPQL